jgi:ABC-type dipeptide/oligopeptide/nickel transport system permease component
VTAYLVRRLLGLAPLLLAVATVVFLLMYVLPGDPVLALVGERFDTETLEALRHEHHLDRPLPERYAHYLGRLARLDLGRSLITRRPVIDSIAETFPRTLLLAAAAMLLAVAAGIATGVFSALRRGTAWDRTAMGASLIGISVPVFWLGLLLVVAFAVTLPFFPPSGFGGGNPRYLALPAVTLAMGSGAFIARMTRSSVLEVIREDYVRTARAKGLPERRVTLGHVLRNSLIPVVTVIGADFGSYLSGAVLTESIFSWPGLGRFTVEAIGRRDFPAIQGAVLFMAIIFVLVNLVVDLAYAWIDPRVGERYTREADRG